MNQVLKWTKVRITEGNLNELCSFFLTRFPTYSRRHFNSAHLERSDDAFSSQHHEFQTVTTQKELCGINSFSLRTHNCGELRSHHIGKTVTLFGWLAYKRLNGRFIVLRDGYGIVQAKIPASELQKYVKKSVPCESAVCVRGVVVDRGKDRNPDLGTGDIEIEVDSIDLLNPAAEPLPTSLEPKGSPSTEHTRLTYRYLDLRTENVQSVLRLRAKTISAMRRFLEDQCSFVEVQTPTLAHFTPGGAAEFCVPASRPHPGLFYSLPQSPQLYKQLLMCGAMDRYYQIAICYRDEGSKLDRQPEFTQLDLELSFTSQQLVRSLVEHVIEASWPAHLDKPVFPFPCIKYAEAMKKYGTDKPDLRIPWQIQSCDCASNPSLKAFVAYVPVDHIKKNVSESSFFTDEKLLQQKGDRVLKMIPNSQSFRIVRLRADCGIADDPRWWSAIPGLSSESEGRAIVHRLLNNKFDNELFTLGQEKVDIENNNPDNDSNIFIVFAWKSTQNGESGISDVSVEQHQKHQQEEYCVEKTLGHLRNLLGEEFVFGPNRAFGGGRPIRRFGFIHSRTGFSEHRSEKIIGGDPFRQFACLWVVDFPLFAPATTKMADGRLESPHHPFTAPIPEHWDQLWKCQNLAGIIGQHYDLVINGCEIGGGSIRIEEPGLQRHVLDTVLRLDTAHLTHFLQALSYGAPPHGGFALGLDRYIALLNAEGDSETMSIRDVIAFPKSASGRCLMTNSPTSPLQTKTDSGDEGLLKRYGLKVVAPTPPPVPPSPTDM